MATPLQIDQISRTAGSLVNPSPTSDKFTMPTSGISVDSAPKPAVLPMSIASPVSPISTSAPAKQAQTQIKKQATELAATIGAPKPPTPTTTAPAAAPAPTTVLTAEQEKKAAQERTAAAAVATPGAIQQGPDGYQAVRGAGEVRDQAFLDLQAKRALEEEQRPKIAAEINAQQTDPIARLKAHPEYADDAALAAGVSAKFDPELGMWVNLTTGKPQIPPSTEPVRTDEKWGSVRGDIIQGGQYFGLTTGQAEAIEKAGLDVKKEYDAAIGKVEEQSRQDQANTLIRSGQSGGLMSSQVAGKAARAPGADWAGSGGTLGRLKTEYEQTIQNLKDEEAAAINKAKDFALTAARTGKAQYFDAANAAQRHIDEIAASREQANADYATNLKKMGEIKKLEVGDATSTISNLVSNGYTIDDLPEAYINDIDQHLQAGGMPPGSARMFFRTQEKVQAAKNLADGEARHKAEIDNAKNIVGLLNDVPLGKSIDIGGITYEGLDRGDVKTGTETDQEGNVTFWSHNELTGRTQTTSLGAIGKAIDGWETKFDDNGNAWRLNARTGQQVPYFPSIAQQGFQEVIPDGSVSPFKDASGNPRIQCGAFANDMTGIGVGDTFESKMAKMNLWKKGAGDPKAVADQLQVGDVFTQKLGTWTGHIGMVLGVETGPNGEPGIRACESNYPVSGKVTSSRFVPFSQIDGFGRGTHVNDLLRSGPDAPGSYQPTFGAKEKAKTQEEKPLSPTEIEKYGLDLSDPANVGLTISGVKERLASGAGKKPAGDIVTPSFEEFARGFEAAAIKDPSITSIKPEQLKEIYQKTAASTPFMMDAARNLSYKFSDKKAPQVVADVRSALESGDYIGAQDKLKKLSLDTADATTVQQVRGRDNSLRAVENIKKDLQEFVAKNGNTNIFSGNVEDARKKIGKVGNAELRKIATKIQASIIDYRHAVSGAGFTASEAQQYSDMFPAITNTQALNEANIDALSEIFKGGNETFYRQQLGNQNYDAIFGS